MFREEQAVEATLFHRLGDLHRADGGVGGKHGHAELRVFESTESHGRLSPLSWSDVREVAVATGTLVEAGCAVDGLAGLDDLTA